MDADSQRRKGISIKGHRLLDYAHHDIFLLLGSVYDSLLRNVSGNPDISAHRISKEMEH